MTGMVKERRDSVPSMDVAVHWERVKVLFASEVPALANILIGTLLVAMAWGDLPSPALLTWLLAMATATGYRIWILRRFQKEANGPAEAPLWERRMLLAVGLTGTVWGTTGIAIALGDLSLLLEGTLAIAACCMLAGAIFSQTAVPRVFITYALLTGIGIIIGMLAIGDREHLIRAGMGVVYLVVLMMWARDTGKRLESGIRLDLENKALIADLAAAREEAEIADRLRRESYAYLGHELRTPLNAIIGFAQSLEGEIWGPLGHQRYQSYAKAIAESGQHLYGLIQDMLDLTRHEAGILELDEAPVNITKMLLSCRQMLLSSARSGQIELQIEAEDEDLWLIGDETKLRQIVINLTTNAIRYTPPSGKVQISTSRDRDGRTRIRVSDTGIGIAAEDIPKVLEPFFQLSGEREQRSGGIGLGLPLSKRLTELHDGQLSIESEPATGTTILITFPAHRAAQPADA